MVSKDSKFSRRKPNETTLELVKSTNAYKELSTMMQSIVKKYKNIKIIENGLHIVSHKGFERFEKEHNFSWQNLLIIKELTNENNLS